MKTFTMTVDVLQTTILYFWSVYKHMGFEALL